MTPSSIRAGVTWQQVVDQQAFQFGDLEIGDEGSFQIRGPIRRISFEGKQVKVELDWVAVRRNADDNWVWAPGLTKTFTSWADDWVRGQYKANYVEFPGGRGKWKLYAAGSKLEPASILTEYFVEVHVRHHLYPPSPSNFENFAIGWNVEPQNPERQEDVEIYAIVFVVHARLWQHATKWCRAECAKWNLPIVGQMKRTYLVRGY